MLYSNYKLPKVTSKDPMISIHPIAQTHTQSHFPPLTPKLKEFKATRSYLLQEAFLGPLI